MGPIGHDLSELVLGKVLLSVHYLLNCVAAIQPWFFACIQLQGKGSAQTVPQ